MIQTSIRALDTASTSSNQETPPLPPPSAETPTLAGPQLKQISNQANNSWYLLYGELNDKVIFAAGDYTNGRELWALDYVTEAFYLLRDIAEGSGSSAPRGFLKSNSLLFFVAEDSAGATQVFRTDGTSQGTIQLTQFPVVSANANITLINSAFGVFFAADDGTHGAEIWKSNGTTSGTAILKDINPGTDSSFYIGDYLYFTSIGTDYFFKASAIATGEELWKTDGTEIGTVLVKDINPGAPGASLSNFAKLGSNLIFVATTAATGLELWISDGTGPGTVLLKDIRVGSSNSNIQTFKVNGSKAYFYARQTVNYELWETDGTLGGTNKISLVVPFSLTQLFQFTSNYIFYYGTKTATSEIGLFAYNLTTTTETFVMTTSGVSGSSIIEMGGYLYSPISTAAAGMEVYRVNLTTLAVNLVKDINVGTGSGASNIVPFDSTRFLVRGNSGSTGFEPWISDGTSGGTLLLKDIYPGVIGDTFTWPALSYNGYRYFAAVQNGGSPKLWKTDGTAINTLPLSGSPILNIVDLSSSPAPKAVIGSKLFFTQMDFISGYEMWAVDAASESTVKITEMNSEKSMSSYHLSNLYTFKNKLYFNAQDDLIGESLWSTDGTTSGTQMVIDTLPAGDTGAGDNVRPFVSDSDFLYFKSNAAATGNEIWKTDGTTIGTTLLKDIVVGAGYASLGTGNGFAVNGKVVFSLLVPGTGLELWSTDGTAGGTNLMKDFVAGAPSGIGFDFGIDGVVLNGYHYFKADDGVVGAELWRTDGTLAGTTLVKNINPTASGSSPRGFTLLGNKIVFLADDGSTGLELWITDGTPSGTVLLKETIPGATYGAVSKFSPILINGVSKLIFTVTDPSFGMEPWITDGTTAGTFLLKDINPGAPSSMSVLLTEYGQLGEWYYFVATDDVHGTEIWRTNGTTAGTELYMETQAGSGSRKPTFVYNVGGKLVISAISNILSREVYLIVP